jgi:fumarylacetoacetase
VLGRAGKAVLAGTGDVTTSGSAGVPVDKTHHPDLRSWIDSANGHPDFPIQNLPLGVFEPLARSGTDSSGGRGGIRIGDEILDLPALARTGLLTGAAQVAAKAAAASRLNGLFELGPEPRKDLRRQVSALLTRGAHQQGTLEPLLSPVAESTLSLPVAVGDYTDFYVGIHHAATVGSLFRPNNPLLPNYKWVPIAYHGRASTVQPSGRPFHRPNGQVKTPDGSAPTYEPSGRLDFELELGVWIGSENQPGQPIPIRRAAEHVAGFCLLNDWSTRDVQAWEYQPLGPFLSKNFATTVSAWVITPEALAPYRIPLPARPPGDPNPLPYLWDEHDQRCGGIDLDLEVLIATQQMRDNSVPAQRLSLSSTRHMYWSIAQMIAHHTSGGCNLRPGDLLGSGTISAPHRDGCGSMLELTHGGSELVQLPTGETRTFLLDGDEIILRARAVRPGAVSVGFGECRAVVLPALPTVSR